MLCRSMQAMLPDQSGLLTDVHKSLSCSFAFLVCCFCVILLFFFSPFAACRPATCLGRASILQTWYPRVLTTVTHLKLIP